MSQIEGSVDKRATIIELHELIRQKSSTRWPVLKYFFRKSSRNRQKMLETQYLEGITQGIFHSDKAAAAALYQSDNRDHRFRKMQNRVLDKLFHALLFLNIGTRSHSEYLTNLYSAKRDVWIAEVLEIFSMHRAYLYVVNRTLPKARKYQLTEVQLKCYALLSRYYGMYGPRSKCARYTNLVSETLLVFQAEQRANLFQNQIFAEFSGQFAPRPELAGFLEQACETVQRDSTAYGTRRLMLNYFVLQGTAYQVSGQWTKALENYKNLLQYLNTHQHLASRFWRFLACRLIVACCVFLRDYKTGAGYMLQGFHLAKIDTPNWYYFVEDVFLLYMHSGAYDKGAELFKAVLKQDHFRDVPQRLEKWHLCEAYLRFALYDSQTALLPPSTTVHGHTFDINRVLNNSVLTRRDKRGLNIALLIAQACHYLRERKFDPLSARIKSLQEYERRQLRKDSNFLPYYRTQAFLKILRAMDNAQYAPDTTRQAAIPWITKMCDVARIEHPGSMHALEIIPYETLTDLLIRELEAIEREGHFVRPGNQ